MKGPIPAAMSHRYGMSRWVIDLRFLIICSMYRSAHKSSLLHWTPTTTFTTTEYLSKHYSLCSQRWLHLWWKLIKYHHSLDRDIWTRLFANICNSFAMEHSNMEHNRYITTFVNRQLRCIRLNLHNRKLHYSNLTFLKSNQIYLRHKPEYQWMKTQIYTLQHIQNFLARIAANTPKYSHITRFWISSLAKNRHTLKPISLIYKVLIISLPPCLRNLISLQTARNIHACPPPSLLWKRLIAFFNMPRLISGTNFLTSCFTS